MHGPEHVVDVLVPEPPFDLRLRHGTVEAEVRGALDALLDVDDDPGLRLTASREAVRHGEGVVGMEVDEEPLTRIQQLE